MLVMNGDGTCRDDALLIMVHPEVKRGHFNPNHKAESGGDIPALPRKKRNQ